MQNVVITSKSSGSFLLWLVNVFMCSLLFRGLMLTLWRKEPNALVQLLLQSWKRLVDFIYSCSSNPAMMVLCHCIVFWRKIPFHQFLYYAGFNTVFLSSSSVDKILQGSLWQAWWRTTMPSLIIILSQTLWINSFDLQEHLRHCWDPVWCKGLSRELILIRFSWFTLSLNTCCVVVNLLKADEQDRVMKRKARFGSLTTSPDSVSIAVCVTAFTFCLMLSFTVSISHRFIVIFSKYC